VGAPRIHGELLMVGIEVARSTLAKYMGREIDRPRRTERGPCATMPLASSIDLFVVRSISFTHATLISSAQ